MFVFVVVCILLAALAIGATIRALIGDDRGRIPDLPGYDTRRPLP